VANDAFTITPEMRDGLYQRLLEANVTLDRSAYDSAEDYVEEQLGCEIAREMFGAESVLRRQAKSDRQLQSAFRILRASRSQDEVIAAATR
jgi:hypothetical protein